MAEPNSCFRYLKIWRKLIAVVLVPILLLPMPVIIGTQESYCGFLVLLMAIYWCTELLPIPVTSLLPVVFLPIFGIVPANDVIPKYFQNIVMMHTGSIIVALAIKRNRLDRRIALVMLSKMGTKSLWLMLGIMLPTFMLSMWITNTGTTAMMLPIVIAILDEIEKSTSEMEDVSKKETKLENEKPKETKLENGKNYLLVTIKDSDTSIYPLEDSTDMTAIKQHISTKEMESLSNCLIFCTSHAANVGGIATLTGTGPNMIVKGYVDVLWASHGLDSAITFTNWLIYGLPIALILLLSTWIWIFVFFNGFRALFRRKPARTSSRDDAINHVIQKEYEKLGSMKGSEIVLLVEFSMLVLVWFFRRPAFIPGWNSAFEKGYVSNTVPSIFIAVLMFIIPAKIRDVQTYQPLLDWQTVQTEFPWGIIFLFGGGYGLAEGCKRSGLSEYLGTSMSNLKHLPDGVIVFIICIFATTLTEFCSNASTSALIIPILADLAEGMGRNPLLLLLPATATLSLSFMLPVSTPPNALAFATGRIKLSDMIKVGAVMNVLGILTILSATFLWGEAYFKFSESPWTFNITNNGTGYS